MGDFVINGQSPRKPSNKDKDSYPESVLDKIAMDASKLNNLPVYTMSIQLEIRT